MEPDEVRFDNDLDPGRIWSGERSADAKQPMSHPWSYKRTVLNRGPRRTAAKSTVAEVVNKPSPRRERRTNRRRGEVKAPVGQAASNADRESCPKGHSYLDPANVYVSYTKRGWVHRRCRTCALDKQRRKQAAQPKKPERVGPRGAAALALTSLTCRRGHPWSHNAIVRGGNSALTGTRLCKACRDNRLAEAKHERWRAEMNRRADEERERQEAENRAFAERRQELAYQRQQQQMAEWKTRGLLHRWSPDGEPGSDPAPFRVMRLSPRALRLER